MRKRVVPTAADQPRQPGGQPGEEWLDLDRLAEVEVTSEDEDYPVEGALVPGEASGWRAAAPGEQTIRLLFPEPVRLHRIELEFVEPDRSRSQEFVLRWSPDGGRTFTEIVRQQWNFSPDGASRETEEFHVDLDAVTALELVVVPDISGGDARASLLRMRLA